MLPRGTVHPASPRPSQGPPPSSPAWTAMRASSTHQNVRAASCVLGVVPSIYIVHGCSLSSKNWHYVARMPKVLCIERDKRNDVPPHIPWCTLFFCPPLFSFLLYSLYLIDYIPSNKVLVSYKVHFKFYINGCKLWGEERPNKILHCVRNEASAVYVWLGQQLPQKWMQHNFLHAHVYASG